MDGVARRVAVAPIHTATAPFSPLFGFQRGNDDGLERVSPNGCRTDGTQPARQYGRRGLARHDGLPIRTSLPPPRLLIAGCITRALRAGSKTTQRRHCKTRGGHRHAVIARREQKDCAIASRKRNGSGQARTDDLEVVCTLILASRATDYATEPPRLVLLDISGARRANIKPIAFSPIHSSSARLVTSFPLTACARCAARIRCKGVVKTFRTHVQSVFRFRQ